MIALVTVFIVVVVSLLITRIATVILTATGLSREAARFQARSAFTGVGFTTGEAESVTNHPVRRRVIMALMLFGSAGIVAVIATLIISFAGTSGSGQALLRALVLLGGLTALLVFARSAWVDRHLSRLIARGLQRWTDLETRDYASLLMLSDRYAVMELKVQPADWVAEKTLGELILRDEGIAVLAISRPDGTYLGAPIGPTRVHAEDTLILYGHESALGELDGRAAGPEGDRAHVEAVRRQEQALRGAEPG